MHLSCLLGHKQYHKNLIKYGGRWLLVAVTLSAYIVPQPVLAFETNLPSSPSIKMVALVEIKGREYPLGELPTYSYGDSGVVRACPTVITEEGDWEEKRLAYAASSKSTAAQSRTYPTLENPLVMEGEASYYSRSGCLGCSPSLTMANGQPLNDGALTMAIGADKSYLVGRKAKVTNMSNGMSVEVLVTDTGGFYKDKYGNRVADLTIATKQAIGMNGGVGQVKVEVY
jgi:rare lipoprotein A (peptidoglycan hydrolase)